MAKKNAAVITDKAIKVGIPREDKILYTVVNIVMVIWLAVVLFPVVFILASSFSSSQAINAGRVLLWPVDFNTGSYYVVFHYKLVWTSFANTVYYTVFGTVLNLIATTMLAYPLSRKNMQFRGFYTMLYIIPMFIGGGIIPSYLNMRSLGLLNSRWSMMLPGLIGTSSMIIMRTFFQNSIPADLHEAAEIDGCSEIRYLLQVAIPLSKAVISVLTLYYAVGHWNAYFNSLLYLRDSSKYPLQLVLRTILITTSSTDLTEIDASAQEEAQQAGESMRYALIVVATVPILTVYPFIQKYFEKGVMIGSLKG